MFSQDSHFQYDVKMLSFNRFDKLSKSTYLTLAETHQKYLSDPKYLNSSFYNYMCLVKDLLVSNTIDTSYYLFIQKIQEINEANTQIIAQISNDSIL